MKKITPSKVMSCIWLTIGIIALVGAIAKGAYWHIGSVGLCYLMWDSFRG